MAVGQSPAGREVELQGRTAVRATQLYRVIAVSTGLQHVGRTPMKQENVCKFLCLSDDSRWLSIYSTKLGIFAVRVELTSGWFCYLFNESRFL